ncbi:MAG: L,D-transpeptidase family protein [Phycisphaerae bacterium]
MTTDRPENGPLDGGPHADVPERGANPFDKPATTRSDEHTKRATSLMASARNAATEDDLVLARAHFSEALNDGLTPTDEIEARTELRQLGRKTIFSSNVVRGDPLAAYRVVAPGDSLHKIAKAHKVTAEFLAKINGIGDMNLIQAGRRLKVVNGPFHARITKSAHTLDVFCGNTFVDHFKVGLGEDDSTPSGRWMVKHKLKNPTYYPPRGGDIIGADDLKNPLGERWIGLEGIDGDAAGQMRYGIHGTIEPESIGKNNSMGCIRLHNQDVETLFDLLIENESIVEIRD